MNKKESRRKKHKQGKSGGSRNILDSEIIGGEKESGEAEETLLGNLARVKVIPMLIWFNIPATPCFSQVIHIPPEKSGLNDFEKFFRDAADSEKCDLVGFTSVKDFYGNVEYDEVGPGSIGIALQIKKVERTALNSLILTTRGICRYENIGFVDTPEDSYFKIRVRWFEDEREPDSLIIPHYEKNLKIIERLSKVAGEGMKDFFNVSRTTEYDYEAMQYGSFILINKFENWFTFEEQMEMFRLTSTSERLKRVNERLEKLLPFIETREQLRRVGQNN